ncbi:MAG: methyl-accepting chemotaxis protein [Proteobacteria bacterium]|nr:methyl-accepting chemotaxis protein [Pseudomonadota bacterium]
MNGFSLLTVGGLLVGLSIYMSMESQKLVQVKTMSLLSQQAEKEVTMVVENISSQLKYNFNQAYQQVSSINRAINNLDKTQLRPQLVNLIKSTLRDNPDVIGIWSFWEVNKIDGRDKEFVDNEMAGSNETGRFAFNVYYDETGNIIANTTPEFLIEAFSSVRQGEEYSSYSCSIITLKACVFGPDELEIDIDMETSYKINIATISIPILRDGKYAGNTGMDLSIDQLSDFLSEANQRLYRGQGKMTVIGSFNKVAGNSADKTLAGQYVNKLWPDLFNWMKGANQNGKLAINLDEATDTYHVVLPFEPIKGASKWSILYSVPRSIVLEAATTLDTELSNAVLKNVFIQIVACVVIGLIGLIAVFVSAGNIVKPIKGVTAMLKEIAQGEGDLTKRLKSEGNDELAEMANWFNQFLEQLQNMVSKISSVTHDLDASTGENLNVTKDTQEKITMQQSEIDQVATAVQEMAASSQEIAKNSAETADHAKSADDIAQKGLQNVHQTTQRINELSDELNSTVEVINNLADNSSRISNIINIIFVIAEQTNLLALNAAIESARAGEHGRGFAVVADEVRLLAKRTQQSTQEIQPMVDELMNGMEKAAKTVTNNQDSVKEIVSLADGTGEAISEMVNAVTRISDMSIQIAAAVEEQSCVTEEINRNIVGISDVSIEVQKGSNHVKESSQTVSQLTAELDTLVNKFKT